MHLCRHISGPGRTEARSPAKRGRLFGLQVRVSARVCGSLWYTNRNDRRKKKVRSLLPFTPTKLDSSFSLQRCNAQRPACHTCMVAGKEFECLYDDDVRQDMTTALLLRNTELEQRLALLESQSQNAPPSLIEFSSPTSSSDWSNGSGIFPPPYAGTSHRSAILFDLLSILFVILHIRQEWSELATSDVRRVSRILTQPSHRQL